MKSVYVKSLCAALLPALFSLPLLSHADDSKKGQEENTHWSYTGETGPTHWGDLAPANITCKQGKNQSPVDIKRTFDARLPSIKFEYKMLIGENIVNNGHTIQVNIRKGGLIKVDGKDFFLKQFHFHSSSEHEVNGQNFPLEAHFVHANEEGELAVVALLYKPGPADAALNEIVKNMPFNAGDEVRLGSRELELFERSKKVKNYVRYNGSLTTPPCTEGVRWIILQKNPTMSRNQLRAFHKALKQANNRPVQPANARTILR